MAVFSLASLHAIAVGEPTASATNSLERLASLSLEDVLHSEVTSVSKYPQTFFESAAAISVISDEDIARSGVRSIPDALRLVPGMTVASMDSHSWAISARGLTDLLSDRLLVMIDGRTVYSPLFAGTFWDLQNYPLADIARIEVIRGPGGALWGANAVNGVVNIVTKSSQDTLGGFVTAGSGTVERGFLDARYGAKISDELTGRLYFSTYKRENFPNGFDDSQNIQGGFRTDWLRDQTTITLQGDYYHSETDQRVVYGSYAAYLPNQPFPLVDARFPGDGGNVLGRAVHRFSDESEIQLQAYYDRVEHNFLGTPTRQEIYDVELQHRFPLPLNQSLMYGIGYRYMPDYIQTLHNFGADPSSSGHQVASAFVQDEIKITPESLRLTLGTKVEHNDYTGFEFQPTARLSFLPTPRQTYWASVSRSVQVPGRLDHDGFTPGVDAISYPPAPGPGGGLIPVFSKTYAPQGPNTKIQETITYELGSRFQLSDQFAVDVSGFYNEYSDFLISDVQDTQFLTTPFPLYLVRYDIVNGGRAQTYGFEGDVEWHATENWRLVGTYSLLKEHLDDTVANLSIFSRGREPVQQVSLRSSLDLPHDIQFDLWGKFVDQLQFFQVKAYFNLDVRIAWRPTRRIEAAIVGKNLIEGPRVEFGSESYLPTQVTPVPRSVYGQVTFKF
jgi:iron complex outermembrane recepter protein